MTKDQLKQLAAYEAEIAQNHPTHDRTSCNDTNLYNAGTVMLRHRCERCESLQQLKYWKMACELLIITNLTLKEGDMNDKRFCNCRN